MSIRFSKFTVENDASGQIFFIGGVPAKFDDLLDNNLFYGFSKSHDIKSVRVETYLYGEEEPVDATPEEVVYMQMRLNRNPDFLESRCEKYSDSVLYA